MLSSFSSLVIEGDVADVWRRPLDLRRAEAQVVEDFLDDGGLFYEGYQLQSAVTLGALEHIGTCPPSLTS